MYSIVLMAALATSPTAPAGHGCHGCHGCYGCHGCWGCHGCYGCYGCWGCYGGCYGCYGCYGGCYGCYGCYGCCGGCYGSAYAPVYGAPVAPVAPAGEAVPPPKKEEKKEAGLNRARLYVELPADAKLFIDDQPMKTTSAKRTFNTPTLERGQAYYYIVRAEVQRDGKTYRESKRVIVRAGQLSQASFNDLVANRNLVEKPVQTAGR